MVIFFNVTEAREYFLKTGHVYTIRDKRKSIDLSEARQGSYYKFVGLGKVNIKEIIMLPDLSSCFELLKPYVVESGFASVNDWTKKIKEDNRVFPQYVYRVDKIE